jgi:hypothetical protein
MGLTADGTPVLQFLDKDGEATWTAPTSAEPGDGSSNAKPSSSESSVTGGSTASDRKA